MQPKIILVSPQAAEAALRITLTRRELLKGTGVLTGRLALSSALAVFGPSRAWALELQGLDTHQGVVLLAFTRQLYTHPTLDDAAYALVRQGPRRESTEGRHRAPATGRRRQAARCKSGRLRLDQTRQRHGGERCRGSGGHALLHDGEQHRDRLALQQHDGLPALRLWRVGRRRRLPVQGFNSLSWLPDPSAAASGPIPKDS
jgi:hypothetical protein